jgi:hypothetical protein
VVRIANPMYKPGGHMCGSSVARVLLGIQVDHIR